MQTFLVEIGTEELPPKALRTLASAFATHLTDELDNAQFSHGQVEWFASPRRLAVTVRTLADSQPDSTLVKRGPAVAQAFDKDGQPTPAALGWAKGCGITVEQAERLTQNGSGWLSFTQQLKGKSIQTVILSLVNTALTKLPVPKLMRWSDKTTPFIRPVHTLTLLYGSTLIEGELFGIASGRTIYGHRFMGQQQLTLNHADDYVSLLAEKGCVIADYEARKKLISQQVDALARTINGHADLNEHLLEEVTSLVEYPVALAATFEEKFLNVPSEALVYTMKNDQKYFPVYDSTGQLLPHFIFVSNIASSDPQQVIEGNEKVIRPRLADAAFFFETDRKIRLDDYLPQLDNVIFQQQLGTLKDKTNRIQVLAAWIADHIGADVTLATRAGLLAKCDLMTKMVFEFPETQGIMGMHYARHDNENEVVATAINAHYLPRFAGDILPPTTVACSVAIADKIDTLTGIFGIGQHPKGDKDPFALRRAALGVLRIIVEKQLPLDLVPLIEEACRQYGNKLTNTTVVNDVIDFMLARFRAWYQDAGYSIDSIQAVLVRRPTRPADFDARIKAVTHFKQLPDAQALAEANKRVSNILSKNPVSTSTLVDRNLLCEEAEIALVDHIDALEQTLIPLIENGDYQAALSQLARLRQPIEHLFEHVMIIADDPALKTNRLALLAGLHALFLQIADISLLQR